MRSEPLGARLWRGLFSQGLGLVCALLTVLLLAVGSVVLAATRQGASRGVTLDELRGFVEPWAWTHSWLYLLLATFAVYALNTFLCTTRSVLAKLRARVTAPSAWGPAVLHVSFLLALAAHLWGGLTAGEGGRAMLDHRWRPLTDGTSARVRSLDRTLHADGTAKSVRAQVELRDAQGAISTRVLGFNEPLSFALGSTLFLLEQHGDVPSRAVVRVGDASCALEVDQGCDAHGRFLRLARLAEMDESPVALLDELGEARPRSHWLGLGSQVQLADGTVATLERVERAPALVSRLRRNPAHPLLLAAGLLSLLGVALMSARLWGVRRGADGPAQR